MAASAAGTQQASRQGEGKGPAGPGGQHSTARPARGVRGRVQSARHAGALVAGLDLTQRAVDVLRTTALLRVGGGVDLRASSQDRLSVVEQQLLTLLRVLRVLRVLRA